MNKFITLALVLFASVALAHCGNRQYAGNAPYGSAPAVQQVSLASLPSSANVEQILNGASSSSSSAASSAAAPAAPAYAPAAPAYAPAAVPAYAPAAAPAYAPVAAPAYAPAQSYAPAAAPAYAPAAAPAYAPAAAPAYAPAPRYSVAPAVAGQLYPGVNQYKTYQSPPSYSTVALPIAPSDPVARLYVPQPRPYAANIGTSY